MTPASFTGGFLLVPHALIDNRRLRIGAHHTWMIIARHAGPDRTCQLTRTQIMTEQGISYPTLKLYMSSLVDHGLLTVERSIGKLNTFTVIYPSE